MRTIFITSFHPLISRNILLPLLPHLMEKSDVRVTLFVPEKKKSYFSQVFVRDRIALEGVSPNLSLAERFLRYASLAALDTETLRIKRKTEMRGSGTMLSRLIGGASHHRWLRSMSMHVTPTGMLRSAFNAWNPNVVFSTDIQNELDVRILESAKQRGIKTIAMVRSWDNPTSKGVFRFIPDRLLVQNDIMKQELVRFHGIPASLISVIGIPHYDFYLEPMQINREEFFKQIGGDPSRKTVLFAPVGDRYLRDNTVDKEVVDMLDKALPEHAQILVRLPPTDTVSGLENRTREGRIIFDRPANPFKTPKKAEISKEAEEHLKASVYYADLIVSGPSTIAVDGAFFGKPVILIGFDGTRQRPYYESVRHYYDYNHWKPILVSGGVRLTESPEDFKAQVGMYLNDPPRDALGRRRIVETQVSFADGKSSERLINFLL